MFPGLVLIAGIVSGVSLLHSGYPSYGDIWPHLVRLQATFEAFRAGHLPSWSFYFYQGYPLLRFYSPLFYYVGALFCFVSRGDVFAAAKVVAFLLHAGSGVAAYLLARRVLRDSAAAFIAALCYEFSYWHLFWVSSLGRLPVGLVFLLMPLCLWLYDRLFERPNLRRAALAGFVLGLVPLTHIFYAFYWIPLLVVWLLPEWLRLTGARRCRLVWLLVSALVAAGISAFFTVPFLAEAAQHRSLLPSLPVPAPSLLVLLGLVRQGSGYSGTYVGLSVVALAACGLVALARRRPLTKDQPPMNADERRPGEARSVLSASVGVHRRLIMDGPFWALLLSLALSFSAWTPIAKALPMAGDLSTDRFLVYVLVFLSLMAGLGFRMIGQLPVVRGRSVLQPRALGNELRAARLLWLPVSVLILLDLGPKVFSDVYRSREDLLDAREYVYAFLAGKGDGRLLDVPAEGPDVNVRYMRYPANGYLFAGMPSVLGPPYHQFAPRSMLYAYAWADDVAQELQDSSQDTLSNRALQELRLMDVKYVVALPAAKPRSSESAASYVFLKNGLVWNDSLVRQAVEEQMRRSADSESHSPIEPLAIGTFASAAPVIVAPAVEPLAQEQLSSDDTGPFGHSDTRPLWERLHTFYVASDWRELPDRMGLDPLTGVAERILLGSEVRDQGENRPPTPDSRPLLLTVGRVKVNEELVEIQVSVSESCFARLAYSFYPELAVSVDDDPVPVRETADHCLLIRLPAGTHEIQVRPRNTPIRQAMLVLSLACLLFAAVAVLVGGEERGLKGSREARMTKYE